MPSRCWAIALSAWLVAVKAAALCYMAMTSLHSNNYLSLSQTDNKINSLHLSLVLSVLLGAVWRVIVYRQKSEIELIGPMMPYTPHFGD